MLIYLSALILLITPLIILIIRTARPGFLYHWLLALGGAILAWPLLLLAGMDLPQTLSLHIWKPEALYSSSPVLLVDQFSWPFAAGIVTLLLGVILTDAARPAEVDWSILAGELALAGWGLFAVLAGNPLTLLLAWTAVDLLSLTIVLGEVRVAGVSREIVLKFSALLAGSFLLLATALSAANPGLGFDFPVNSPQVLLLFIVAAGLRLGVFPLRFPNPQGPLVRRGLDILVQLIPAASALVLLARSASLLGTSEEAASYSSLVLLLIGGIGLVGATAWYVSLDEFEGRHPWVLGTATLALASSLRGQAEASLAWGLAAIFAGGLLLLATFRNQRVSWFMVAGLLAISALPLTPTWSGAGLFGAPFTPPLVLFFVVHVLMLLGYARHILRFSGSFTGLERWVMLIYPLGLGLLMLVYYWVGWRARPDMAELPLVYWLEGPLALVVAGIALLWMNRNEQVWARSRLVVESLFSQRLPYILGNVIYQLLDRMVGFITLILEGEGGILWVLLWTVLLVLLLIRL